MIRPYQCCSPVMHANHHPRCLPREATALMAACTNYPPSHRGSSRLIAVYLDPSWPIAEIFHLYTDTSIMTIRRRSLLFAIVHRTALLRPNILFVSFQDRVDYPQPTTCATEQSAVLLNDSSAYIYSKV